MTRIAQIQTAIKDLSRFTNRASAPSPPRTGRGLGRGVEVVLIFASSCSQIRTTRQPARRSVRVTSRSRARLPDSFRRQNARLFLGLVARFGQPCQKQPSTKTASRAFGKTKSGLPKARNPGRV